MVKAPKVLKEELQRERNQLIGRIAANYKFSADAVGSREKMEWLLRQQAASSHLRQVEAALRELENGSYGICEQCGRSIDPARLEILPYATLCIECQIRREKVSRPASRSFPRFQKVGE